MTGIAFVDSRTSLLVQAADSGADALNRYGGGDAGFGKCLKASGAGRGMVAGYSGELKSSGVMRSPRAGTPAIRGLRG